MSQNQSAARTPHTRKAWLKSLTAKPALIALTAAGLIAGSAGMAAAAPSSSAAPAAAAATGTVTLHLGGASFTFAKFGGMTDDETLPQTQPTSGTDHTAPVPNVIRPTISLGGPLFTTTGIVVTYKDMLAWEQEERDGISSAPKTVTITLNNDAGVAIQSWVLENAVPINVDVAGGDPQSTSFTVVLTGDELLLQA